MSETRLPKKPLVWDISIAKAIPLGDEAKDFAIEGTFPVTGIEVWSRWGDLSRQPGPASFQLLIGHVKEYTPEWASTITGVPAETIRRITKEFIEHAIVGATIKIGGVNLPYPAGMHTRGKGVNNGWGAYQSVWAQYVLMMLTEHSKSRVKRGMLLRILS